MWKVLLVPLLVVLNFRSGKTYVAPVLSVCSRTDPAFDKCVIAVVERVRQNVADANYGDGRVAPKLNPVMFDRLSINKPGFRLDMKDVKIEGIQNFEVKKFRSDLPGKQFHIFSSIQNLKIKGKYDMNMNILLLHASGKGDFNLELNDTSATMKMEYEVVPKDGKQFVRFKPIDLKLKFPKARFHLTGLFNGDPALEEFGNRAINENPNILLDEVKPAFEKNLARVFTEISNSVVDGAEESELLPP